MWIPLTIIASGLTLWLIVSLAGERACRKAKHASLAERISDSQFCDALNLHDPLERSVCATIRRESAKLFRLTPEELLPDSPTMPLNNRAWTPFIAFDIVMGLEDEISKLLETPVNLSECEEQMDSELPFSLQWFGRKETAKSFGQWTEKFTKIITNHIKRNGGKKNDQT